MSSAELSPKAFIESYWYYVISNRLRGAVDRKTVYLDIMRSSMQHMLKKWITDNRPEDLEWFEKMLVLL
jgi:hypothetical protein